MELDQLRTWMKLRHILNRSWRETGAAWGISGAMAYRIVVNNYEPRSPRIRAILDLPPLIRVQVVPCPKCGEAHTTKRCTNGNGKPRNRRAINLDNPQSAAATIIRHAHFQPDELIQHLLKLMEE